MEYLEYYESVKEIKASDQLIHEAFWVMSKMYDTNWGWKDNKCSLTNKKLSIVYAFNMAKSIKEYILKSENYKNAIKECSDNLWHVYTKKKNYECTWLYQRNTILGIVYYSLAVENNINQDILNFLEDCTLKFKLPLVNLYIKNRGGMIFFNEFKNAVLKKQELNNNQNLHEKSTNNHRTIKIDKYVAQDYFNKIFRDGLDMEKIGNAIEKLFENKTLKSKAVKFYQHYWYVVFVWFMEIGFIEKQKKGKTFRGWLQAMFGEIGYATLGDFNEAQKILGKSLPSEWKETEKNMGYIYIRDYMAEHFNKNKRNDFILTNRHIDWDLNKKMKKQG